MLKKILCSLVSVVLAGSIILGIGKKASAKDMKDFLIIGSQAVTAGWKNKLEELGLYVEVITKSDEKKGLILPSYEELKKYDALMLVPFSTPSKESKQDLSQFIENGGVLFWWYDGPVRAKRLGAEWSFKILGFDSYKASHHIPYDQKTPKENKLRYASSKWGNTETISKYSSVYTIFATDLFEAKPVVVDVDNPERAFITVRDLGKGKAVFCGGELGKPTEAYFKRLLEYIGVKSLSRSENLFRNPGAEIGDKKPAFWHAFDAQRDNPGHCEWAISTEVKHKGRKSAYMKGNTSGYHGGYSVSPSIGLKPDTQYRYSAWVKTRNITGHVTTLYVQWKKPDGKGASSAGPKISGTTEWKYYERVFKTPGGNGPTEVTFSVILLSGEGEVWVDDIELIELKESKSETAVSRSGFVPSFPPWPEYKGRLVARKDYKVSADWAPPKIMGKEFWIFLNPKHKTRYPKEMKKINEEPMVRETITSSGTYFHSLAERERPLFYRLVLREIEVYEPKSKKNIAPSASPSAGAKEAEVKYIERINDKDTSIQGASFSSPPKRKDQEGWFSLEFNQEKLINRVVIYGGRPRTEGSEDYVYLPSHFVLQYKDNSTWKDIPGTEIKNNCLPINDLIFSPIKTKAIRLYIYSQTTPVIISTAAFKNLNLPSDTPFWISSLASRPPFPCLDDYIVKKGAKEEYLKWKKEHPNFMGFNISEWDNDYISYLCSPWGSKILRRGHASEVLVKRVEEEFQNPKNREQALSGLKDYYQAIRKYHFDDPDKLLFLRGGYCFDHYSLEWGASGTWLETTNTGPYRHQVSLFFIRGASRQYRKPWGWYIALYYNGYDEKGVFSSNNVPCYVKQTPGGGPDYGMSPSLNKRDRYLAYLSGANIVLSESWPEAYCKDKDNDGTWELSPHGEVMKEWYTFTQRNPERGISYTPVALLLPFSHGQSSWGGKPWAFLPEGRYDYMIDAFMYTIVPQDNSLRKGEEGCLFNSPYGDIYDVLLPNPPSGPISLKTLNNYKVSILLGKFNIDKPFAERLMQYVREGGTLLLNVKQVNKYFPVSFLGAKPTSKVYPVEGKIKSLISKESFSLTDNYEYQEIKIEKAKPILVDSKNNVMVCVNKYGKGNLILTTVDYLIPKDNLSSVRQPGKKLPFISFLLKHIVEEPLPLKVKGDIEYGLNKLKDGWLVYLINNKGVVKYTKSPQRLNSEKTAKVEIILKSIKPKEITELREDKKISWDRRKNSFFVDVGPGDVSVVKIRTDEDK